MPTLNILLQAAMEIMEKQGVSLADRPRLVAAGKMLGGELSIGLAPVGDRFNRKRRFVICDTPQISSFLRCNVM